MSTDHLRGPVAWMARNGVAANLLMFFLVAAGITSLSNIIQEVFPEVSLDTIQVQVEYPGATPEEIEESIVQRVEERIKGVEDIKEVSATAAENVGSIRIELTRDAVVSRALDDIKAEIDRIVSFPEQVERPEVSELTNRQSALRIALYGDVSERALKEIAYRTEEGLSSLSEVSYVATSGVRSYEVSIEVPNDVLRAYGLTLQDVAMAVRRGSMDLSAGNIRTRSQEVRVRTLGQNYNQQDFEEIVVLSRPDGAEVRLGQIANVQDGFEETQLLTSYNGQRAAFVEVFRTSDERVLEVVEAAHAYIDSQVRTSLPEGISIEVWEDNAVILQDRMDLLMKNAYIGLFLVITALALFLNFRLAFWTAIGIVVAFIATLSVMPLLGVSINLLTLFAFILAIGIVVDDAIVVGENIYAVREKGTPPLDSAILGATRITRPVIFAVFTTVAAFVPLMFIPGTMGKMMNALPIVVISVLIFSLIESLLILPYHLSHLPDPKKATENRFLKRLEKLQRGVDRGLKRFIDGPLNRGLRFATGRPGVIVAAGFVMIVLSITLVANGYIRLAFMPEIEGDVVTASLEMPDGTSIMQTNRVAERIADAGRVAGDKIQTDLGEEAPPFVESIYTVVGQEAQVLRPDASGPGGLSSNIANVQFKLQTAEDRPLSAEFFEQQWREETGAVVGVKSLNFESALINFGAPIHLEVSHPSDEALSGIAGRVVTELNQYEGVYDVESDQQEGTSEIQLELRPEARSLGLTLDGLAREVRAAFFGEEALRVQRGREDVRVYIRLPGNERDAIADLEAFHVQIAGGGEVPLGQVAYVSMGAAPASIQRKDGRRVVTITANVDAEMVTGQEVSDQLRAEVLPTIADDYPEMTYAFGGEQQEQAESFGALGRGFMLAMFAIYALLAIPFRSYTQPLVIMAAIPFGIIGAMMGHLLMDIPLGMLSLFGIIGLSGVVVNDGLVMIDFVNEAHREGLPMRDAIIRGAKERFRPILLTSITTFLGVSPMIFERSLQAQFLIPMAVSLGFGIIFATGILMLIVPAMAMIEHKVVSRFKRASSDAGSASGELKPIVG